MRRCSILSVGLILVLALLVSGVTGFSTSKTDISTPVDNFVMDLRAPVRTLDPAIAQGDFARSIIENVYEPLIDYKGTNTTELSPKLAKSWTVSEDGRTYTFRLRQDVEFHNGNDFTAEDVKYTIDHFFEIDKQPVTVLEAADIAPQNVEIIDPYTIQFETEKQLPRFIFLARLRHALILDKQWGESHDNEYISMHENGTAPYTIQSWEKKQGLNLVKFPDYWGGWEGKHVPEVSLDIVPEYSTRLLELRKGQIDATYIPKGHLSDVQDKEGIVVDRSGFETYVLYVHINNQWEYFKNKKVRQALAYSFPYEQTIKVAYRGTAFKAQGLIGKGVVGYPESMEGQWYHQDLEKAKDLLAEAGYPNGLPEPVTMWYDTGRPARKKMGLLWRKYLKDLGITLKVQAQDWPTLAERLDEGELDLYASGWYPEIPSASNYIKQVVSKYKGIKGNFAWYENEKVDELVQKAETALDKEKREELYLQVSKLLKEDSPMIFVAQMKPMAVYRSWVKGYYQNPFKFGGGYDFYSIYKE